MFRFAPDNEDGADVSPERQQQGESDQEAGGEGGSDGWYRDTDDSEPDDASEGKHPNLVVLRLSHPVKEF